MYGDIHGVIGSSLPEIKGLTFDIVPKIAGEPEAGETGFLKLELDKEPESTE